MHTGRRQLEAAFENLVNVIDDGAHEEHEMRQRKQRRDRVDQPLRMVPVIGELIDSQVAHARDMYGILCKARAKPQVLDAATVDGVKRQFREQREHIADYEWQLERWRNRKKLTGKQRAEINRLAGELEPLRAVNQMVLDLADELAQGTIDAIMGMDDAELRLRTLLGLIPPP